MRHRNEIKRELGSVYVECPVCETRRIYYPRTKRSLSVLRIICSNCNKQYSVESNRVILDWTNKND